MIFTFLPDEFRGLDSNTKGCFDLQMHSELLILANPLVKIKKEEQIKEDISGALTGKGAKVWMRGTEPQQWFHDHRAKYLDVQGMDKGGAKDWVRVGFQYGDVVLKKVTELLEQLARFLELSKQGEAQQQQQGKHEEKEE